jgi:hypothetical protein
VTWWLGVPFIGARLRGTGRAPRWVANGARAWQTRATLVGQARVVTSKEELVGAGPTGMASSARWQEAGGQGMGEGDPTPKGHA